LSIIHENHGNGTELRSNLPPVALGSKIVTKQSVRLMDFEELIAWELLYTTVVDCYKIATSQWRHFRIMMWHKQHDHENILSTARKHVKNWIESDQFAFYLTVCGWEPEDALPGIRQVYDGKRNKEVGTLLKQIIKERDARRKRG